MSKQQRSKEWLELREIVRELSYEEREVTLSSGLKSNFYIDVKQTALNSKGSYLIGKVILDIIKHDFTNPDAVGGITMGADPLATAVSVLSHQDGNDIPAFYIRKEPKAHGTARWIEGMKNVKSNAKVVILEDVVTTGASTLKACSKAEEEGLKVIGIISVVDREEGGRENVEKAGYKLRAIFTRTDILEGISSKK